MLGEIAYNINVKKRRPCFTRYRPDGKAVISISVVSHSQAVLVKALLGDLSAHVAADQIEVIFTVNVEEPLPFSAGDFPFRLQIVRNAAPRGFGMNHNAAFVLAAGGYFCVLNPDIRISADIFPRLLESVSKTSAGVVSPLIVSTAGVNEDHARRFPTLLGILKKVFLGAKGPDYVLGNNDYSPDWVAGMFMLFRAETFRQLNGFDDGYFLYYEDVDLCWRLRRAGLGVTVVPAVRVIHDARRTSHTNIRYLRWHLASMLRFFWKRFVG